MCNRDPFVNKMTEGRRNHAVRTSLNAGRAGIGMNEVPRAKSVLKGMGYKASPDEMVWTSESDQVEFKATPGSDTVEMLFSETGEKHGNHDQSSHGRRGGTGGGNQSASR